MRLSDLQHKDIVALEVEFSIKILSTDLFIADFVPKCSVEILYFSIRFLTTS